MDAALTLACGLAVEERAARAGGARATRVGLGAALPLPDGPLASFGLAGALVSGYQPGALVTATRVVDERGDLLWEGAPLPVPEAVAAVVCAAQRVVDTPVERASLAARTGAVAVDMESGPLAASGRLVGVVRAISDTPEEPVGRLVGAATADGHTAWGALAAAFLREPRRSARAARNARRGLAALERAAGALAATEPA